MKMLTRILLHSYTQDGQCRHQHKRQSIQAQHQPALRCQTQVRGGGKSILVGIKVPEEAVAGRAGVNGG